MRIHLATGLLVRNGAVLLVASRYPGHPEALWNLPGGRQRPNELLPQTVQREVREETGLNAHVHELVYVSESYDGETQVTNATFRIEAEGEGVVASDDHVVELAWVPIAEVRERVRVRVVREPLLAALRGELPSRYAGFPEAGISIRWDD
jgi:ADP-ribose pyrophosphatase YjhB (NUDIX family)